MIILKYIIMGVLGLTLACISLIGLYFVWFVMVPEFYKHIKESWFNK